MEKSKGHICWVRWQDMTPDAPTTTAEYFERGGEVYRAPIYNPVMIDGFRCGRYECSKPTWDKYKDVIIGAFGNVVEN